MAQEAVRMRCVAALAVLFQKLTGKQGGEARSQVNIGPPLALEVPVGSGPTSVEGRPLLGSSQLAALLSSPCGVAIQKP